jgi:hypothetical protein
MLVDRAHILGGQPPPQPMPQIRAHKTTFMDTGWRIEPGQHPVTGTPCIAMIAADDTELVIYPFDDVLTFATFRRACDAMAERYRQAAQSAQDNGKPDDDVDNITGRD